MMIITANKIRHWPGVNRARITHSIAMTPNPSCIENIVDTPTQISKSPATTTEK